LHAQGIRARCVLVGAPDPENPSAVPVERINAWVEAGLIEWWGQRDDMPATLNQSHIVCLPSYREGLPKVLAEAAACARPIVTSDAPGCREVVRHGENGLLVPVRDAAALTQALATLIHNPELRSSYGQAGRRRAETEFGSERVVDATLAIYHVMLDER
jgi:glycosyltransferase involved in cell wall biosynthesis